MPGSYILITYNDTTNLPSTIKNNVCLYFTYDTDAITGENITDEWFLDETNIPCPNKCTFDNINNILVSNALNVVVSFIETVNDLSFIFGEVPNAIGIGSNTPITTYTIEYDQVSKEYTALLNSVYSYPISLTISNVKPSCFSEGTKILCFNEEYRLVEDLKIGDMVKTYLHDYKPIKNIMTGFFINDINEASKCMYIMKKTPENGLIDDLIVTGCHGILLDENDVIETEQKRNLDWANFKVDGKINCIASVSSKFEQIKTSQLYKYYHFSLDNTFKNNNCDNTCDNTCDKNTDNNNCDGRRFGVWANGVLMETPPYI
jgi:hypothetical protein